MPRPAEQRALCRPPAEPHRAGSGRAGAEGQRLPPPDEAAVPAVHGLVLPRRLPVPAPRRAAGAHAGQVLAAPGAEEVALMAGSPMARTCRGRRRGWPAR